MRGEYNGHAKLLSQNVAYVWSSKGTDLYRAKSFATFNSTFFCSSEEIVSMPSSSKNPTLLIACVFGLRKMVLKAQEG